MQILIVISFGLISLVGCKTTVPTSLDAPTKLEWRKGRFDLSFRAGVQGFDHESSFFYEITYLDDEQRTQKVVMESAHGVDGFRSANWGDPQKWIRMVEDPNGKALLIEEVIPNDCGPSSNYLFAHLEFNGVLKGVYLQLPSKVTGPPEGINYEYPYVRSLDGDFLTYDYRRGPTVTKCITQIEQTENPTPPG
jgi:hypothetical protein